MSTTNKKILKIIGLASIVVIIFIVVVVVMTYIFDSNSVLTQSMRRVVPMPAATINRTHWVSAVAVDDNVRALRHKLGSPEVAESGLRVDFTTPEGEKRLLIRKKDILNKLVEDEVIVILAKDRDIVIADEDALAEVKNVFQTSGEKNNIDEQILEGYGWDTDTFIEQIVIPRLYRDQLEEWFHKNTTPDPAFRERIQVAQKELDDDRTFEEVAKKYSEGRGASNGGKMGWFARELLIKELSAATFAMEEGDVSAVIETPIGYHIIRVDEIKQADDEAPKLVNVSQIIVKKRTFADWLEEQMRTMRFRVPTAEFTWDDEHLVVDFSDPAMRAFEEQARKNPQGDASLF